MSGFYCQICGELWEGKREAIECCPVSYRLGYIFPFCGHRMVVVAIYGAFLWCEVDSEGRMCTLRMHKGSRVTIESGSLEKGPLNV